MEKIFRNKTAAPTTPGDYYVRPKVIPEEAILPMKVWFDDEIGSLWISVFEHQFPISMFDFFGPVPACYEG